MADKQDRLSVAFDYRLLAKIVFKGRSRQDLRRRKKNGVIWKGLAFKTNSIPAGLKRIKSFRIGEENCLAETQAIAKENKRSETNEGNVRLQKLFGKEKQNEKFCLPNGISHQQKASHAQCSIWSVNYHKDLVTKIFGWFRTRLVPFECNRLRI